MNHTVKYSRETLAGNVGQVILHKWSPGNPSRSPLIILPNGYGVLPYARSVCEEFALRGRAVYSVDTRGQGASEGEWTIFGAAEDIVTAMLEVSKRESAVDLLMHCSAALSLIRVGKNADIWNLVTSSLLYCYLAEPELHLKRFQLKCERYGVRIARNVGSLDRYGPDAYCSIPTPISIVHPRSPTNLRRASLPQVEHLAKAVSATALDTPTFGYNINCHPQRSVVTKTAEVMDAIFSDMRV